MKRFIHIAAAFALIGGLAVATGGCTTAADGSTVIDPTVVADAQNIAQAVCGFLPTADTVANILATGNPALATGEAIGTAICAAEKGSTSTASARRRAGDAAVPVPTVAGVPIVGTFVGK